MQQLTKSAFLLTCSIVFFLCTGCTSDSLIPKKDQIHYTIKIDEQQPKIAYVQATFVPKDSLLYMAPGGSQISNRWGNFVKNLKVTTKTGKIVDTKELTDAQWQIDAVINETVTLSYELHLTHEEHQWSGGIDGVAYANDWGVFYAGRTLFIMNGTDWKHISVDFSISETWNVTTPWIAQEELNNFIVPNLTDLAESMLFAGTHQEFSMKRDDFELIFALGGEDIIAQQEAFKNMASGVLDYYIDLMGGIPNPSPENAFKKAVVVINPSNTTDGEVIGNNISILIEKDGDAMSKMISRFIFAHEFFHLWSGKSFAPTDDDCEWFKEGITNYYTLKALHHVGFLNDESYLEVFSNFFYQKYATDDGVGSLSLTNGEAKHNHWGLIYGGGFFVGVAQDMLIRKSSNNEKSLDDLMKQLFQKYGGTTNNYTLEELKQSFSDLNGTDQSDFFENYITGTNRIPIESYLQHAGIQYKLNEQQLQLSINKEASALETQIRQGFFGLK